METLRKIRFFALAACVSAGLASAPVFAQHVGGVGHVGAAVGHGGVNGGFHGGYGWRGGYYGGWRGGYGYGWRGGFYPWGWGGVGLGLGLYFATLPYYYSTYYWGGVPYYYADNTYYTWDTDVGQYRTVSPPAGLQNPGAPQGSQGSAQTDLIAYPKNGQSQEQLGKDKFECHKWAASQTGFDPTQLGGGSAPGNRSDYFRAQAACLEGRGYSVK